MILILNGIAGQTFPDSERMKKKFFPSANKNSQPASADDAY